MVSLAVAAEFLGVDPRTVRARIETGEFEARRQIPIPGPHSEHATSPPVSELLLLALHEVSKRNAVSLQLGHVSDSQSTRLAMCSQTRDSSPLSSSRAIQTSMGA